jgi:mRNA-degrading endonuclease RelE of RelBE toxin-antitoxin system
MEPPIIATAARCIRLPQLATDVKHLRKRFRSVEIDLISAERLLEAGETLPQTTPYPGFGGNHKIFKTRIVNIDLAKGKSSGYRLIYEEIKAENSVARTNMVVLLMLLYDKAMYEEENKVRSEVWARLKSPEYNQGV